MSTSAILSTLTKKELGEVAKKENIKISQSWLKAEIIDAILAERGKKNLQAPKTSAASRRGEY